MTYFKPKAVFIIRHAEKPGLNGTDSEDEGVHLSEIGHSRAAALAEQGTRLFEMFGKIDVVFAAAPSKASIRPVETITPYAESRKLKVKTKFEDKEYKKLVMRLFNKKYDDKVALICWHHGMIPELIRTLGGNPNVGPIKAIKKKGIYPEYKWHEDIFDSVIVIDFSLGIAKTTSTNQSLLFGDNS